MNPAPSDIIVELVKKYSECTSYSDEGVATDGDATVRFLTKFVRPDDLLFQFSVERKGLVVSSNSVRSKNGHTQYTNAGKWLDAKSPHFALTVVGGASAGASTIILRLLLCPISNPLWQQFIPYEIETISSDSTAAILRGKSKLSHGNDFIHMDVSKMTVLEHRSELTNGVSAMMARRLAEIGVKGDQTFAKLFMNFLGKPLLYATHVNFEKMNFDCLDSTEE